MYFEWFHEKTQEVDDIPKKLLWMQTFHKSPAQAKCLLKIARCISLAMNSDKIVHMF